MIAGTSLDEYEYRYLGYRYLSTSPSTSNVAAVTRAIHEYQILSILYIVSIECRNTSIKQT